MATILNLLPKFLKLTGPVINPKSNYIYETPDGIQLGGRKILSTNPDGSLSGAAAGAVRGAVGRLARSLAEAYGDAMSDNVFENDLLSSPPTITEGGAAPTPGFQIGYWSTNGAAYFRVNGLTDITSTEYLYAMGNYARARGARTAAGANNATATSGYTVEFVTDAPSFLLEFTGSVTQVCHFSVGTPDMREMRLASSAGFTRASQNTNLLIDWSGVRKMRGYRFYFALDQGFGRITVGANDTLYAPKKPLLKILDIGDSFIANTLSPTTLQGNLFGLPNCSREMLGSNVIGQGIGSSGYINGIAFSAANPFRFEDAAAANADLIRVWLGGNDTSNSGTAIQAAASASLASLRAAVGADVPILVFGPNAGTANLSAALLTTEAAINAAVSGLADQRMSFVPVNIASSETAVEMSGDGRTIIFTAALSAATSATLTETWPGTTGSRSVMFSDGSVRAATLTTGSAAVSWTGAVTASDTAGAYTVAGNAARMIGRDGAHPSAYGALYIARRRAQMTVRAVVDNGW